MPNRAGWRCGQCATINLGSAESCRRCGAGRALSLRATKGRDSAALAAALSLFLPGLGQMYTQQVAKGALLFLAPVAVGAAVAAALLLSDALMAQALRVGVGLAAAAVTVAACYHVIVVGDAFAARSTAGRGFLRKSIVDYAVLASAAVVIGVIYLTLFRQATAWAALAQRVFEPFHQTEQPIAAPEWRGRERLNVLILGVDTRANETNSPQNSDTLIVLTVDPVNKSAAMLSIPRDTLVTIPGHGADKINAAYGIGGPDLARRTVSEFLGVPVHAYGLVDFAGFTKAIDSVGGVIVDSSRPVRDEAYPTEDYGVTRLAIRAGPQQMDGTLALRFARSRHGSNDFSRAERQQDVLAALKRRADQTGLLLRLPAYVEDLSEAVRTDLVPANVPSLGALAAGVSLDSVRNAVLRPPDESGPGELREVSGPTGYYLIPVRAAVAALVAELFYDPQIRREAARVELRASSAKSGLAQELAATLGRREYQVVRVASLPEQRQTTVVLRNPAKRYSATALAQTLGGTLAEGGLEADADIVVLLGDDYRGLAEAR